MKRRGPIRDWQLIRWKKRDLTVDLSQAELITVGKRAFYKNAFPEEVILPAGLSAIKTEAFAGCRMLKTVSLPKESGVGLARGAFAGCERLDSIKNSDRITSVGDFAFAGCSDLREFRFGPLLVKIGERAFLDAFSLSEIELPAGLTVGREAFRGCRNLTAVTLSEGFHSLSEGIFRDCVSLKRIRFPESVEEIPANAFRSCRALTRLEIPGTVSRIGAHAFDGCLRLSEVELGLGVTEIGAGAFAKIPRLSSVTVPHTLRKLGPYAFGKGKSTEKTEIRVESEYMLRRMKKLLRRCHSAGRTVVLLGGKTLKERRRERSRKKLEQPPAHII